MANTLLPGDQFFADIRYYDSRRPGAGEVVLMRPQDHPDMVYVKRVAAVPGDTVTVTADGVAVNGRRLDVYRHAPHTETRAGNWPQKTYVLGEEEYFLLGDNFQHSVDSRFFGPVALRALCGKPLYIHYSTEPARFGARL